MSKGPRRHGAGTVFPLRTREMCAHSPGNDHDKELKTTMADFVQKTNVKTAVRTLATPIADVTAFNTIVQSVITGNPFACVSYVSAGKTHPGVEKTREDYVAKLVYQDADAKKTGTGSHAFNSVAGYTAGVPALIAAASVNTAHNGTPVHDEAKDSFSATVKFHDPNGEIYEIVFGRDSVRLASYEDDAIRAKVETWADSVAALA